MNRKKLLIVVLAIALLVGAVSAAVITYYGKVKVATTVSQAVLLDGNSYPFVIEETATVVGGESFCRPHYLTSQTSIPIDLQFDTTFSPALTDNEITVTYLKPLGYSWSGAIGGQPISIDVEDGECQVTWTVDFPLEAPYDEVTEGNGLMAVGLIIALDGEGYGPAFQIHNNDGTDSNYPWGTWLYSPWGPTIGDGWFGWHSGSINTPVSDLDWVDCTGGRYNEVNPDGLFTVIIDKCKLGEDFHWALYTAIGSGFNSNYLTYQQATYPDAFNWAEPLVTATNYEYALLMEELTSPFTLQPKETLDFIICYSFDPLIQAGTYNIYSTVQPPP